MPEDRKRPGPRGARPARKVNPCRWAAATMAGLALVQPALMTLGSPGKAIAATAGEAGEVGEAGESGMAVEDPQIAYLAELGLFEAAYRIAAALYAAGETAAAAEHLETSHHAFYEDIAADVLAHGAPGFADAVDAFAEAVNGGAAPELVSARAEAIYRAIAAAGAAAGADPRERLMALHELMDVAAADYAGGVENGAVIEAHEYRDAWGFVDTVRARAEALASDPDPALAEAGRAVLGQLAPLAPLFPGLSATKAAGDPADLAAAAAWIEIAALRLK